MKKLIQKFKHNSFSKSFYFKMFIFYFIFMIIIVSSSSFILMNYLTKKLENEVQKSNQRLLTQVQIFFDRYVIDKINSIINENFFDFSQTENVYEFFNYKDVSKPSTFYQVHKDVSNLITNNNFIDSIYLFRQNDNTLISSIEGVNFNILNNNYPYKNVINMDLINKAMNSSKTKMWISPLENENYFKDKTILSFVQSIPLFTNNKDKVGCVIFNINHNVLFESINKVFNTNTGNLLIIDSNGRILAHTDIAKLSLSVKYISNSETILDDNNGFFISNVNGKRMGISWKKSALNDWKYVSIIPIEVLNERVLVARQFTILIICSILFFSFMGLKLITSHLYKPINNLINSTKKRFNITHNTDNELTYINNVINNLSIRMDEMKELATKNHTLILYKLAVDILVGNIKSYNEVDNRLKFIGKNFNLKQYGLVLIEINKQTYAKLSSSQREYTEYKIIEIINNYFNKKSSSITICYPYNCIATIINCNNYEDVICNINELMELLKTELKLTYNICVSKPSDDILSLSKIYNNTKKYLNYGFIHGYNNIFTYNIIEKFESQNRELDLNILEELKSLLKSCKIDTLKNKINEIIKYAKDNYYSYDYLQNILLQIIRLVCKVCREQNITSEQLNRKKLIAEFNNISSAEQCMKWLYSIIDKYYESIKERNVSIDYEFVSKIANYIVNNIDTEISLFNVAKEFNVSTSHLSKIFKKGLGTSFADYVKDKKLEKAAQLLILNKGKHISDIAQDVGYLTLPYFSKLFKQKYGMTPTQYRKKMCI